MTLPFWCGEASGDGVSWGSASDAQRESPPFVAVPRTAIDDPDQHDLAMLRDGDANALDRLMQRYAGDLARFVAAFTGTPDVAQDVVQDVFIKLWHDRATIVIRGSVAGYLLRMARNRALNILRHERSAARAVKAASREVVHVVHNNAAVVLEARELAQLIREAVATLSPRSREIFLMRRQGGMSSSAVAEATGISAAAVQVYLSRALRRIAEYLAERLG